jgi:hypothetical protein
MWERYFEMTRLIPWPLVSAECFLGVPLGRVVEEYQQMTSRQAVLDGNKVAARSDYANIKPVVTDREGQLWDILPGANGYAASMLAALRH